MELNLCLFHWILLLQHSCIKRQRQLLGMEGDTGSGWFPQHNAREIQDCTSPRISQRLCGQDLKSKCVVHLCDLYFVFPVNEMRLSADPNIPKNLVLFKCQSQSHLWALQLRPSSETWLLTLAYLFRLCWQPRQRSKGLVLLLIWIQHM